MILNDKWSELSILRSGIIIWKDKSPKSFIPPFYKFYQNNKSIEFFNNSTKICVITNNSRNLLNVFKSLKSYNDNFTVPLNFNIAELRVFLLIIYSESYTICTSSYC